MTKRAAMRYTFADLIAAAKAADFVERIRADLAEFAAENLDDTEAAGLVQFFDIATGDAFDVPPTEAMGYFRAKGLQTSFSYADMIGRANDQAFTVAKMMDVDMLKQVRDSLDSALANGESFGQWKKGLTPILQAAGWWGEADVIDPSTGQTTRAQLGSAWRLETIFRTNMQTAYAAGQWGMIQDQADIAPFLMYDAVDDFRTRAVHRAWDGTVLPVNSPWWKSHTPPNGWNCRCGVIQLDADQVAAMGITPRADPPDDGSYTWENPRTGQRVRVPNGLDPGFDRNPGEVVTENLWQLIREKVTALPASMQQAVAPVLRRVFDTTTDAGRWHAVSFDQSPDWMRERVLDQQAVSVQRRAKKGAWARGGYLIEMDGYKESDAYAQSVWRHEFGHVFDVRSGRNTLYRSSETDFLEAQKADADALAIAAGAGRASAANNATRAAVVKAYEDARDRMIDTPGADRENVLRTMATAAGLDYDAFITLVRGSTTILDEPAMGGVSHLATSVRIARMIEAVRLGDGEGFVRYGVAKDAVDDARRSGLHSGPYQEATHNAWRKDGSFASLSDLIGSATRNKAANFRAGFYGHTDAYYRRDKSNAPAESWANLYTLAAHPNPYWFEITRRFTPRMADLFREILGGAT